jgi:hypothetical protein
MVKLMNLREFIDIAIERAEKRFNSGDKEGAINLLENVAKIAIQDAIDSMKETKDDEILVGERKQNRETQS